MAINVKVTRWLVVSCFTFVFQEPTKKNYLEMIENTFDLEKVGMSPEKFYDSVKLDLNKHQRDIKFVEFVAIFVLTFPGQGTNFTGCKIVV